MIQRRHTSFYPHMIRDVFRYLLDKNLQGENHTAIFEKVLADYLRVEEVVTVATGREGMAQIFDGLGLSEGDEVLIPAYTLKELLPFFAERGLKPVPVDVDASSFNIDPARIEEAITPRSRALMVAHMFGMPADMDAITAIAQRRKLFLIEDCAHALGSEYGGKRTGTFGDAGFFSFELTKPINTFGGGIVATNNSELAASIRKNIAELPAPGRQLIRKILFSLTEELMVRSPFYFLVAYLFYFKTTRLIIRHLFVIFHGATRATRYRYSQLQAFLGRRWMAHLDDKIDSLNTKAQYLRRQIGANVSFQSETNSIRTTRFLFVGTTPREAGDARRYLLCRGIDIGVYDEITDDCATELGADCPVAHWLFTHAIQIPLNYRLSERQLDRIASAIVDMRRTDTVQ